MGSETTLRGKGRGRSFTVARSVVSDPTPWLQTLRLDLREFARGDVDDIARLDGDPRVMKYIAAVADAPIARKTASSRFLTAA